MKEMPFTRICIMFGLHHVFVSANRKSGQKSVISGVGSWRCLMRSPSLTTYRNLNSEPKQRGR